MIAHLCQIACLQLDSKQLPLSRVWNRIDDTPAASTKVHLLPVLCLRHAVLFWLGLVSNGGARIVVDRLFKLNSTKN